MGSFPEKTIDFQQLPAGLVGTGIESSASDVDGMGTEIHIRHESATLKLIIGSFQIIFSLCFKRSLGAQPVLWK